MLTNNEGLKIAVIVNDVASVNIDSRLVRGRTAMLGDLGDDEAYLTSQPAGIVELQNGCACCSISGELLTSVSELVTLSDMRSDDEKFDHIVIEMSGVAEPRGVRNIFQEAMMYNMPLMDQVSLDTLVTVIDCSTYLDYLRSSRLANVAEAPELYFNNEMDAVQQDGSWIDTLTSFGKKGYEGGGVCDLLVEQTEVADVIVLNKIDILCGDFEDTTQVISALNPKAKIITTSFGKVNKLDEIISVSKGVGVAMGGVVDDHKDWVSAAEAKACTDYECTNPLHAHDHSHSHHNALDDLSDDGQAQSADTSHSHLHSHSHASNNDATIPSGIGTYIYRARRPFHPLRLLSILQMLPVSRGIPEDRNFGTIVDNSAKETFGQVLRSKGFAWTADSNVKALYWSHAGCSFEMQCLGRWWATLPKRQVSSFAVLL